MNLKKDNSINIANYIIMKITVSKQMWLRIAKKAGWYKRIKLSDNNSEEIIEIGGKYYVERGGDIVEVPSPSKQEAIISPKSIPVSTKWGNIILTEGSVEENFYGKYKIISLDLNKNIMIVEYVEIKNPSVTRGEQKTYPIQSQAESIIREKMRQDREMKYNQIQFGSKEFFSVGFLAKYGRIRVEVPLSLKNRFDEMYKKFTGEDPSKFLGHGYAAQLSTETKGNSWEFRITFPNPGTELLNRMDFSNCPPIPSSKNTLEINYSNYVMNLFRLGFTIGTNEHNIPKVLNAIQGEKEKNSFIEGTRVFERLDGVTTEDQR